MVTESQMYWLTRLDYLHGFILAIGLIFTIASIAATVRFTLAKSDEPLKEDKQKYIPYIRLSVVSIFVFLFTILGSFFIPTTKEMCVIKIVPMIVNDKQVQEIPSKVVDLANEWLNELKPDKILSED